MKTLNIAGIAQGYVHLLRVVGIAWGLIYFVVGAASSFTIGINDTWRSIALLFLIFLLPLPIAVVAVWFPRAAAVALIMCAAFSTVIFISLSGIDDAMTASPGIRWFVPHFSFVLAGRKKATSIVGHS
ncbi:MAG: hypothetical protein ABSC48_18935 [Terracidiphilus sp.]